MLSIGQPSWSLSIQVMTFEEAEKFRWNPFDLTKVKGEIFKKWIEFCIYRFFRKSQIWPQKEFPRIPVGRLVLNRNPSNYFAEVEQLAFSPAHMVPGIEPSPDKMLQVIRETDVVGKKFLFSKRKRFRITCLEKIKNFLNVMHCHK